ncbi:MAG TPA: NADP-dependent malic enzyme [Bacteroidales bacterium]|nr:NADP-dependent malic enzyme [Bacteroidales bacterium]HSA42948.1 NADP-dependent malic enzyme [Bacteroidales bacterium]
MDTLFRKDALSYHAEGRPGKIEVIPTKPYATQRDLSLAYTPGVADPCLKIKDNPDDVYKYTAKGNLVAVISNGTAVLGLGDIGTEAGKPVMEGKGLLFKIFADIDVFDIEIETKDVDKLVETIIQIAPTFGGINLEDIKAPECFEVEDRVKAALKIPVMHDDQHGTAIITSAGLLNALEITGKDISKVKIVVNGAGASAISCSRLYIKLGVNPENIVMFDSKGCLHKGRTDLNPVKAQFANEKDYGSLEEAVKGADMFLGLSVAGVFKKEWLHTMNVQPIIFALANPVPEIMYNDAISTREDIIMATGRSDYPNQINNVLGFPFIFRGAMDVMATEINDEMKLAASRALASLAKMPVPDEVNMAYNTMNLHFSKDYIIPKPFDPRLITHVAPAVAQAAMETGVARKPITDWDNYKEELGKRLGTTNPLVRQIKSRAKKNPKRVVFADSENFKMLKAAEICLNEGIAIPILLGNMQKISSMIREMELELDDVEIIDPKSDEVKATRHRFAEIFFQKRQRRGVTLVSAKDILTHRNYYAPMLVETGYADAMISGLTRNYPDSIRPALQVIGKKPGGNVVSGMYIINTKQGPFFFADCTVNKNPSTDQLVEITLQTAFAVQQFNIVPRIALLAYSNFGSNTGEVPMKVRDAVSILHKEYPDLVVDGELQANVALNAELMKNEFPFSKLVDGPANTLIFPFLSAGNIAYKLMQEMARFEVIGPVLNGLDKSVHVLQLGSSVSEIVNMVTIAVLDAQCVEKRTKTGEKCR